MIKECNTILNRIATLPKEDQPKLLGRFLEVLSRRGMSSLLPKLLSLQTNSENGNTQARITLARCTSKDDAKDIIKQHENILSPYIFEVIEDPRLIGGYVLEAPGVRIDASYRSGLVALSRRIVS